MAFPRQSYDLSPALPETAEVDEHRPAKALDFGKRWKQALARCWHQVQCNLKEKRKSPDTIIVMRHTSCCWQCGSWIAEDKLSV